MAPSGIPSVATTNAARNTTALASAAGTAERPAALALLPRLVGELRLAPANALLHTVQDLGVVVGPVHAVGEGGSGSRVVGRGRLLGQGAGYIRGHAQIGQGPLHVGEPVAEDRPGEPEEDVGMTNLRRATTVPLERALDIGAPRRHLVDHHAADIQFVPGLLNLADITSENASLQAVVAVIDGGQRLIANAQLIER